MNSKLLFTLACCLLLLPGVTFAQNTGFIPLIGIPGVTDNGLNFNNYINALYALSISVAALIAVVKIIIAGMKWMLSDVVTRKSDAIDEIKGAVFGLVVVISAVLILTVINPQLTETQIFLQPVSDTTRPAGPAQSAAPTSGTGYRALDLRTASTEAIETFSRECGAATGSIYRVEGAGTVVCYAPLPGNVTDEINRQFPGASNLAEIQRRYQTTHYPRLIQSEGTQSTIRQRHDATDVLIAVTLSPQNDWLDQGNTRVMQSTCTDFQRSTGQPVTLVRGNMNGSNYLACVMLPADTTAPTLGAGA